MGELKRIAKAIGNKTANAFRKLLSKLLSLVKFLLHPVTLIVIGLFLIALLAGSAVSTIGISHFEPLCPDGSYKIASFYGYSDIVCEPPEGEGRYEQETQAEIGRDLMGSRDDRLQENPRKPYGEEDPPDDKVTDKEGDQGLDFNEREGTDVIPTDVNGDWVHKTKNPPKDSDGPVKVINDGDESMIEGLGEPEPNYDLSDHKYKQVNKDSNPNSAPDSTENINIMFPESTENININISDLYIDNTGLPEYIPYSSEGNIMTSYRLKDGTVLTKGMVDMGLVPRSSSPDDNIFGYGDSSIHPTKEWYAEWFAKEGEEALNELFAGICEGATAKDVYISLLENIAPFETESKRVMAPAGKFHYGAYETRTSLVAQYLLYLNGMSSKSNVSANCSTTPALPSLISGLDTNYVVRAGANLNNYLATALDDKDPSKYKYTARDITDVSTWQPGDIVSVIRDKQGHDQHVYVYAGLSDTPGKMYIYEASFSEIKGSSWSTVKREVDIGYDMVHSEYSTVSIYGIDTDASRDSVKGHINGLLNTAGYQLSTDDKGCWEVIPK